MDSSVLVRSEAARVLGQLLNHQGSLSSLMPTALARVEGKDRPLLQEICYGTARYAPRLGALLAQLLRKPFQQNDLDVQGLLLSALYQLDYMSTPDHAVLNESVETAKVLGKPWAAKLTNAVLRRYQREKDAIKQSVSDDPVYTSNHPDWFIAKLKHNWPEHWESIVNTNDQPPPFTLRVNIDKITRDEYLNQLESENLLASPGRWSPAAIYLDKPCAVDRLPGFKDGLVSVQDEAAQLATPILGCQASERVLDACAAPGGKLCHLLEQSPALSCDALELEPRRAQRIEENLQRLNLKARLMIGDASEQSWWDSAPYDRILLDAPCSATGVIRRNPDIKILRRNEDLLKLAEQQLRILSNLWTMLKPGGHLLYATCSIFPQENERIIERFLKQQQDAEHLPIESEWGETRPFGKQLFAENQGPDGFYYALLRRAPEAS